MSVINGCDSPNKSHTITSSIPFWRNVCSNVLLLAHDHYRNVQLILKPWFLSNKSTPSFLFLHIAYTTIGKTFSLKLHKQILIIPFQLCTCRGYAKHIRLTP